MIVKEASFDVSEPSVDSEVITLHGSGADVFVIAATPKAAAQAIRKSYDLGWNAARYLNSTAASVATTLKPALASKNRRGSLTYPPRSTSATRDGRTTQT
jgi:branched-chain amino acid transport system substrate-binding protein